MPEGGSKTSIMSVVWTNFEFFRRDTKDFLSRFLTMYETWLHHYGSETKQHSMEWRHNGLPRPKNSECKNPLKKFSSRFFGIKTASSSLIIFKRAKLSTRSITHLCWCNWRTFWRKNISGRSPSWSCSCTTMLRLTGHLQRRRNRPTWASNNLITHPILRIWPRRTTTCSLDWRKQLVAIFLPTRRSLLPWRLGWMDNWVFFDWLAKVRATG